MLPENKFNGYPSPRKKAHEISYALFRIAARLGHKSFGEKLEEQALELLIAVTTGESVKSQASVAVIRYLLKFGEDVGILNPINCGLITSELDVLNSAIAELDEAAKPTEVDLRKIFSQVSSAAREDTGDNNNNGNVIKATPHSLTRQTIPATALGNDYNQEINSNGNARNGKSEGRQSTILERIRQNHDCRLKDIQEALQDVSDRTIRYDLQNLLEQGLIERSGNGGPATFYRVRA